jgi:hypothetical protein
MPSPFPGMNPYFERPGAWEDLHVTLIVQMRMMIAARLPEGYFAKTEQLIFIEEPSAEERAMQRRPDTFVGVGADAASAVGPAVVAKPSLSTEFVTDLIEERHVYIEVRRLDDREDGRPVTVIELLSPSNKAGGGREQYLAKRAELIHNDVGLVEIDLLRGHGRMPMNPVPDCDYCVAVARASERPRVDVWAWHLREPLPVVPVPLRPEDGEVPLDLAAALNQAHDEGGYARWLYDLKASNPIHPPLSSADAAWALELVHDAGLAKAG